MPQLRGNEPILGLNNLEAPKGQSSQSGCKEEII
jgi:hypothetical protein